VAGVAFAVLVAPVALAKSGDPVRGGKRNPSHGDFTSETKIIAQNSTYGTRQSNTKSGDGGGAIYGCRSAPGKEPCVRANNLSNGRAFEFQSTSGTEGGFIKVGDGNPNTKATPFGTNAAGKVANLNADRVDDQSADDIVAKARPLWAVVSADGTLSRKNGASAVSHTAGSGQYAVTFSRDVSGCAYTATLGSTDTSTPPAGEAGVAQQSGSASGVIVVTRDSSGATADRPFHLTVDC
jgi:hypothetical protein